MIDLNITNEQKRGLAVLFALSIGIAGFYFLNSRPQSQMPIISDMPPIIAQAETAKLIINVAGKVANPGVYQLPGGSRVIDAIEAAGNQLNPKVAIISVGQGNSYGHPDEQFIDELISRNIQVWRTDQSGGISLATPNKIRVTGKEWWQIRWG